MKTLTYQNALRSCERATRRARREIRIAVKAEDVRTRLAVPEPSALARRNYKGAEFSRIYSDWLAGLLSPNDEIRGDLRTLRARARELARNNAFAGAYLELVTTNVIGPHGMRLRAKTRTLGASLDEKVNAAIEEAWRQWSEGPVTADGRMSLIEFEGLALETVAKEGESFPRRIVNREFPCGLALQMIDPDLVDDNNTLQGPGLDPQIFMGVEVDRLGRRRAYHTLDYPYGPGAGTRAPVRVPAGEVLHVYRARRANQMRGVTWMTRAMAPTKDLERYIQNELVASAAGAAKMGFITNESGTGAVQTDVVATEGVAAGASAGAPAGSRVTVEAEPGSIWELDPGQKFEGWSPDHPSTAFGDFVTVITKWMARGYDVSHSSLTGDLSEVTYLSGRLGQINEKATWRKLQQWWIRVFRQPLFEWWLEAAILSGELELPDPDWHRYRRALWIPRGWDWIDPSKDLDAAEKKLKLKLTSHRRILAEQGEDHEEILEELEDENKSAAKRGIHLITAGPIPSEPGAPAPPASSSGGGTDDDDDAGEADEDDDAPARPSKNGSGKRGASRDLVRR